MKNILVTGGAGYIGSHVCKTLYKNNYDVTVIDNLSTGKKKYLNWGKFYCKVIRNKNDLISVFKKKKFHAVIHLAAKCLVGESVYKVDYYYENNVIGTKNLLDTMVKFKVKNIIFSSTCAIYGDVNKRINENQPLRPVNPYGETKKICEELLATYSSVGKINYISLRYFNAAGADLDLDLGEDRLHETHLIPLILKATKLNKPVKIFGNNYPTKDKTCIRDYIHVSDIARAHLDSLKYIQKNKKSDVINIGTGKGLSILEIVNIVSKVLNKKIKLNFCKPRKGDPPYLVANNKKIKKILSFQNKFSRPKNIIKTAFEWSKKINK